MLPGNQKARTKQKGTALLRCPSASLVWLPQHSRPPAVIRPATARSKGKAHAHLICFENDENSRCAGARQPTTLYAQLRFCFLTAVGSRLTADDRVEKSAVRVHRQ